MHVTPAYRPLSFRTSYLIVLLVWLSCGTSYASTPLVGIWNGFNEQTNVIECTNLNPDSKIKAQLTVYKNEGELLFSSSLTISPLATEHIILQNTELSNNYGLYRVEATSGDSSKIRCLTAFYRFSSGENHKALDYVFAIPADSLSMGTAYGTFNSFNPSGLESEPTYNWLTVYNPGSTNFTAKVNVYDQSGALNKEASFRVKELKPLERRDFALGHNRGQFVGTYEIIPNDGSQVYGSFLTRYGRQNDDFNFAFALLPKSGDCDSTPIPLSTMDPADNWVEIANPSSKRVSLVVNIFGQTGEHLFSQDLSLKPHVQHHIYINPHLGERAIGTLQVSCTNSTDRLLVQSMFYGKRASSPSSIEWAYSSQGSAPTAKQSQVLAMPVNTFLGAANWAKVMNASTEVSDYALAIRDGQSQGVSQSTRGVLARSADDVGLHEIVGRDFIGIATVAPDSNSSIVTAELLRVYPHDDGGIGYIARFPAHLVDVELPDIEDNGGGGGGTDETIGSGANNTDQVISGDYVVFAYNDLGMHCMNQDFSEMMILPPANTLHATVIRRSGEEPNFVTSGVTVKYKVPLNTESATKTNFWEHAQALLGASLAPNIGLSGNGLSGTMEAPSSNSSKEWSATFIPITPVDDNGKEDPYQVATVTVERQGTVVAQTKAVVPVSWEISCDLCHTTQGISVDTDILRKHDQLHATNLENQKPVACGSCHAQAPLGLTGEPGVPSLSRAMHSSHSSRIGAVSNQVGLDCYACHPGIKTQCQRDIHSLKGMDCHDCHGSMSDVATKDSPWLEEPSCGSCHKSSKPKFEFEQSGKLFQHSVGHQGVPCAACHGSPHAIAPTRTTADNLQAIGLQGHAGTIDTCTVCHSSTPDEEFPHKASDD